MSEHAEQVNLFNWADWQSLEWPELGMLFAIPNGGLRNAAGCHGEYAGVALRRGGSARRGGRGGARMVVVQFMAAVVLVFVGLIALEYVFRVRPEMREEERRD